MESQRHEQTADLSRYEASPSNGFLNAFLALLTLLLLVLLVIGLLINWKMMLVLSTGLAEAVILLACFLVPLVLLIAAATYGLNWYLEFQHKREILATE